MLSNESKIEQKGLIWSCSWVKLSWYFPSLWYIVRTFVPVWSTFLGTKTLMVTLKPTSLEMIINSCPRITITYVGAFYGVPLTWSLKEKRRWPRIHRHFNWVIDDRVEQYVTSFRHSIHRRIVGEGPFFFFLCHFTYFSRQIKLMKMRKLIPRIYGHNFPQSKG